MTMYELFFNSEAKKITIEGGHKASVSIENVFGWEIGIKDVKHSEDDHGMGDLLLIICLNDIEAEMLTLGQSPQNGGEFTGDLAFCMDIDTFFDTYTKIPKRIKKILMDLEGYIPGQSVRRFRSSSEKGFEFF